VHAGCSAYDNEAAQHGGGENWSPNDSDDERYERSVLEKRLASTAPPPSTAVVTGGSQHSLGKTSTTSPGGTTGSVRSTTSSAGSTRHSATGKRQSAVPPFSLSLSLSLNPYNYLLLCLG